MSTYDSRQFGDGGDNPAEAAKNIGKAAKRAGKSVGKAAAQAGAKAGAQAGAVATEAVANTAAATAQSGAQAGAAVAQIAAGTAAGGPWGAIIMAAWSMRHTLYKILVCVCLFLVFLIAVIVSLPSLLFEHIAAELADHTVTAPQISIIRLPSLSVLTCLEAGQSAALDAVDALIAAGEYDEELSRASLQIAAEATDDELCFIYAAYSASVERQNADADEMRSMLTAAADSLYPVSYTERTVEKVMPVTYTLYRPVTVTVVTGRVRTGSIGGVAQYRYTTEVRTLYLPDGEATTDAPLTRDAYRSITVELPVYNGEGAISGTTVTQEYYTASGTETLTPEAETVTYLECTVEPLDRAAVLAAFGVDPDAAYGSSSVPYSQVIDTMTYAAMRTLGIEVQP